MSLAVISSGAVPSPNSNPFAEQNAVYKGNFEAAPTVSSSPGFGNALSAMGMYFCRASEDLNAPDSTLMGMMPYSDTDSYFAGLFSSL